MPVRTFALLGAAMFTLAGCAHGPDGTVGKAGAAYVVGDKFNKDWTVMGDRVTNGVNLLGGNFGWRLRSFVSRETGATSHQLYVDMFYSGDWRYYEAASDENAVTLHVVSIDRIVGDCSNTLFGCTLNETVGVDLPEAALRAHAQTGYQIQLRAHSGNQQVLTVTKEMIQEQLAKVDPLVASVRGVGAPAAGIQAGASSPAVPAGSGGTAVPGSRKLGVKSVPTPAPMSALLGVEPGKGMWVVVVDAGSLAEAAGINKGDVVLLVNGTAVNDTSGLLGAIAAAPGGRPVPIVLWTAKAQRQVSVTF